MAKTFVLPISIAIKLAGQTTGVKRLVYLKLASKLMTQDSRFMEMNDLIADEYSIKVWTDNEISELEKDIEVKKRQARR